MIDYDATHLRLMAERDAALSRAERAEGMNDRLLRNDPGDVAEAYRAGFVDGQLGDVPYGESGAARYETRLRAAQARIVALESALSHIAKGFAGLPDDNARVIDGYYRGLAESALDGTNKP